MMKTYIIIGLVMTAQVVFGQAKDPVKMNKDLKVAQTVLESLVKEANQNTWWTNQKDQSAQYIEGYGVVLSLPTHMMHFANMRVEMPPMPDISEAIQKGLEAAEKVEILVEEDEEFDEAEREAIRAERRAELEERRAEIERRAEEVYVRAQQSVQNLDSMRQIKEQAKLDQIKEFLLDYGHLISQLEPDEKILIMEKRPQFRFYNGPNRVDEMKRGNLSAEIRYGDIMAYQDGKINREEAESRIKINKGVEEQPLEKDLALMQSILKRLYQADLAETYFLKSNVTHQRVEGLGVIFFMDMASSTREGNDLWKVPTQNKEGLSQEERDDLVKGLYEDFENGLIDNLVSYGEKVTSLNDDEQIIIKAAITKCEGCDIPDTLELQISGKTLKELNSDKISQKQAKKAVIVNRGPLQ